MSEQKYYKISEHDLGVLIGSMQAKSYLKDKQPLNEVDIAGNNSTVIIDRDPEITTITIKPAIDKEKLGLLFNNNIILKAEIL